MTTAMTTTIGVTLTNGGVRSFVRLERTVEKNQNAASMDGGKLSDITPDVYGSST